MRLRLFVLSLIMVTAPPTAQQLRAQGQIPRLAGHTFVTSNLIPDPFVKTQLGLLIGLGSAFDYEVRGPVLGEDTLVIEEGKMTWVSAELDYRQRVTDWLQLDALVVGGARVGTNAASAIAQGVSVISGFGLGGLARLAQTRSLALSATLTLVRSNSTLLNIVEFAEELIDSVESGGSLGSLSLSRKVSTWQGRGGVRFAWTPTRALGVTALAELRVGEDLLVLDETTTSWDAGALLDLDLHSISSVPLGFVIGYRYGSEAHRSEQTSGGSHRATVGIAYMGREDFSVGLELLGESIPLPNEAQNVTAVIMGLRLRYYF